MDAVHESFLIIGTTITRVSEVHTVHTIICKSEESLTSVTLEGVVEWLITGSITPTSLLHCSTVKQAGMPH